MACLAGNSPLLNYGGPVAKQHNGVRAARLRKNSLCWQIFPLPHGIRRTVQTQKKLEAVTRISVRHVSAPAARSKRSGAPPPRSVRWETSPGLPAAVVPFARAARGNDPIRPASRSDGPLRPVQARGASLQRVLSSCLVRHHTRSRSRSQFMGPRGLKERSKVKFRLLRG